MKLTKYGMLFGVLALMASCSNDNLGGEEPAGNSADAYVSVAITMQTATRTATGQTGEEVGQDEENKAIKCQLIFADASTGAYITASDNIDIPSDKQDIKGNGQTLQTFKVSASAVKDLKKGENVKVYAVINYNANLTEIQKTLELNTADDTYWSSSNGFLMTSAKDCNFVIPTEGLSTNPTAPTNIGTIEVERAAVRFDVATVGATSGDDAALEFTPEGSVVKVTFDAAAVINTAKRFYLYKEVETTTNTTPLARTSFTMLKAETPGLYVNNPLWWEGNTTLKAPEAGDDNFLHYLDATKDAKEAYNFKEFRLLGTNAKDPSTPPTGWTEGRTYKILDYTTPNTLLIKDKQLNGNTTGVVFRAKLDAASQENPISGMSEKKTLYAYGNVMYGDKNGLDSKLKVSEDPKDQNAKDAYTETLQNMQETSEGFKKAMVDAGFTAFDADGDNYYCYYYYWNRHDAAANANDGKMDIMEFGVVRNNIYKLAVTGVTGLGHPGDPGNDPDPVDPDDPDDPDYYYFKVEVKVLPWTVRVNDIIF